MPELPEVETTKRSLNSLIGKVIKDISVFQPKLRWTVPEDLENIKGFTLSEVTRRAKYLVLHFEKGAVTKKVIIHLGMSGSLQQPKLLPNGDCKKQKHDHVIFTFENFNLSLNYHDPRRFGSILWYEEYAEKLFGHLAPEPLSTEFNADYLHTRLKKSSRAIKVSIMDQAYVVGVGNIYATESLFLSGIHPLSVSNKLTKKQIEKLVVHIKTILEKAIEKGGSSLSDFTFATGKTGYFQQTLYAYGRAGEACNICTTKIENIKITGRASAYCPNCQTIKK